MNLANEVNSLRDELNAANESLRDVNTRSTFKDFRIAKLEEDLDLEQEQMRANDAAYGQAIAAKDSRIATLEERLHRERQAQQSAALNTIAKQLDKDDKLLALHAKIRAEREKAKVLSPIDERPQSAGGSPGRTSSPIYRSEPGGSPVRTRQSLEKTPNMNLANEVNSLRDELNAANESLRDVNTRSTFKDFRIAKLEEDLDLEQEQMRANDAAYGQAIAAKDSRIATLEERLHRERQAQQSAALNTIAKQLDKDDKLLALHAKIRAEREKAKVLSPIDERPQSAGGSPGRTSSPIYRSEPGGSPVRTRQSLEKTPI